jgi:hypothetical protein
LHPKGLRVPILTIPAPLANYSASLPYAAPDLAANVGPLPIDEAIRAAAELVAALGPSVAQLAPGGVVPGARWRRHSAGGEHRSWAELDRAIQCRDRFGGRPWCEGDTRTLADVVAQTWGAAEVRACWRRVTWLGDAIVDPVSGELLGLPRKQGMRRVLEACVLALQAGTGGIVMSRHEWAAELGVAPRTVYNYVEPLIAAGLLRRLRLRRKPTDGSAGSWLDRNLYRIGPALERQAAAGYYARRNAKPPGQCTRELAAELDRQLDRRAARRQWDRSGATYRGQVGTVASTRIGDRRTRADRGSAPRPAKRQILPDSPPLSGLAKQLPTEGGQPEVSLRSTKESLRSKPVAIEGRSAVASLRSSTEAGGATLPPRCAPERGEHEASEGRARNVPSATQDAVARQPTDDDGLAAALARGDAMPRGFWRSRFS